MEQVRLRNGTPARAAQCRAAARLGGLWSGVTRRRRRKPTSPRARCNRTGPGRSRPRKNFLRPDASAPPMRVPLIPPAINPRERTAPAGAARAFERPKKTPFDPAKMRTVLQAVAYRGLDYRLDLGDIREHLKRAACVVFDDQLTVRDVEMLDAILRGAEGHRARMQASRSRVPRVPQPPRRACARRPVSPPEVLMRRRPDTQTPSLLAVLDEAPPANYPVTSGFSAPPLDSPAGSVQPPPPHEVKPPLDFRARVEQRRAELAAGGKPLWLDE